MRSRRAQEYNQPGDSMNLTFLSWEAEGRLMLRAGPERRREYQRTQGPVKADPDITFLGVDAHWQPLRSAQRFPDEIIVQERSGGLFRYAGL
jgi:hypothetical protein